MFKMNENPKSYGDGNPITRFFDKVEERPDGCWDWKPTHRDRSGRARYRQMDAAKWSYLTFVGELPPGTEISHSCLKRDCVNPKHLEAKTHAENMTLGPPRGPDKGPRKQGRWQK